MRAPERRSFTAARIITTAGAFCALFWPTAAQQVQTPPSSADEVTITGRVVDAESGEPIPFADVQLRKMWDRGAVKAEPGQSRETLTNSRGRFTFDPVSRGSWTMLTEGGFRLTSTASGYVAGMSGRLRPLGPGGEFEVGPGGRTDVDVLMWREAIIAGTVTDLDGQALRAFSVKAVSLNAATDIAPSGKVYSSAVVARGYEFHVPPGDYLVVAMNRGPGSTIRVAPGERREHVDFQVRQSRTVTIHGDCSGFDLTRNNITLTLTPDEAFPADQFNIGSAIADRECRFTVTDIPPGRYRLKAWEVPRTTGRELAMLAIPPVVTTAVLNVPDDGLSGVSIARDPGRLIRGRVLFAGSGTPKTTAVGLRPATQSIGEAPVESWAADASLGSFEMRSANGRHFAYAFSFEDASRPGDAARWSLTSVNHNGRDLTFEGIDVLDRDISDLVVTLSDRRAEIAGTVRGADGNTRTDATVIMFPVNPRGWTYLQGTSPRVAQVRAMSGRFSFDTLPPGDYFIVAEEDRRLTGLGPALFTRLQPLAARVATRTGERRQIDLVVP